jgi:hypothetical protein
MEKTKVMQIARAHFQLVTSQGVLAPRDADAARAAEAQTLDSLFHEIERECQEYCSAYNEAFGDGRLRCEVHSETVVVRSQQYPQDTFVFERKLPSGSHAADVKAHRYHYPAPPEHPPVGLRRGGNGALTLTFAGQDVQISDLVFDLLTAFTEQLVRTEALERTRNGTDDAGHA